MTTENEKTFGEKLVRSGFNPSENPNVQSLKATAASFIDKNRQVVEEKLSGPDMLAKEDADNIRRWGSLATTYMEMASMFAVKAATA